MSLIKHNQYLVSFEDLKEIEKNAIKFFLELPDFPSITFAPIDVALLNS